LKFGFFTRVILILFVTPLTFAQSTFQNLGFESAQNIPVFDPGNHPWTMPASNALPSWSCYLGTNQVDYADYNDTTLNAAAVSLQSQSSTSPTLPSGFLVGQYCLLLQYGNVYKIAVQGPASVTQTGQLAANVASINFRGTTSFVVSFNGTVIPLSILSSQAGYNVYGGDISQFAGQTGNLSIASYSHFGYLDAIQFSTQAVPEPDTIALLSLGIGLFCFIPHRLKR
jgi:hypothetical protein